MANTIVLKRSATPAKVPTTGNPTITVANGYRTYQFTNSGTITF